MRFGYRADVIRELKRHSLVVDPSRTKQTTYCACQEDRADDDGDMLTMDPSKHAAHVFDALIDAFGVVEETRTNAMSSAGQTTDTRTGVTTSFSDIRYDSRLVFEWRRQI